MARRDSRGLGSGTVVLISLVVSALVSAFVATSMWLVFSITDGPSDSGWSDEAEEVEADDEVDLDPLDRPVEETLRLTIDATDDVQLYRFQVASDTVAVRVRVEGEGKADIDLRVAFGEDDTRSEDWWEESTEDLGDEEVMLYRHDSEDFAQEPLYVEVEYYSSEEDPDEVAYTLRVDVVRFAPQGPYEPGAEIRGRLDKENGHRATYEIRVPDGARAMRFDLVDVDQDLDLYVSPRDDVLDTAEAEHAADTEISRESLVLDGEDVVPGESLFVTVSDRYPLPEATDFRLVATAGTEAPPAIGALPEWPRPTNARERALSAVVEVIAGDGGGSGTIVSPGGLVLTSYHVVDEASGDAPLVIAVTLDVRRPARDAFRARVVQIFEDEDLALLEIVSDLYGRQLPADYRLPVCPVAWDFAPLPGDVLHTAGYPGIGSWTGRGAITLSSGVMSGYGVTDSGPKLKTDAIISAGSSGGAALDDGFRLVGVPTQTRWQTEDGSETLGYASPVTRIPAEWRRLIQQR